MNKQITFRKIEQILKKNGYVHKRTKGSHFIYEKDGKCIVINLKINACVWNRLIREYSIIL